MKKTLCALLALCLLAALLATGALAADKPELTGTCGDNAEWEFYSDGRLVITKSGVNDAIEANWTGLDKTKVTRLEIQTRISDISDGAFEGFVNLKVLDFYSTLGGHPAKITIGDNAFAGCTSIEDIVGPLAQAGQSWRDDDLTIGTGNDYLLAVLPKSGSKFTIQDSNKNTWEFNWENGYAGGKRTATVTKGSEGSGVVGTVLGGTSSAKRLMGQLTELTFGEGITEIGDNAFESKTQLDKVSFTDGLKTIGDRAFYGTSITSVDLPDSVTEVGEYAFSECESLASLELSEGLTEISAHAFDGCTALTSVDLPDGITSIGDYAFQRTRITGIDISNVTSIGEYAFSNSGLESVEIPDGITSIDGFFQYCGGLKSVIIPDSVETIGEMAFYGTSLTSIDIPESVTSIGDFAFGRCTSLKSIDIPESVTSIGYCAFQYSGLESVYVPDNVTNLGSHVFSCCASLKTATIGGGVMKTGSSTFEKCTSLTSVEMDVSAMGGMDFYGCTSLTDVKLSDRLIDLGEGTFWKCTALETLTLPDLVKNIGYMAFYDCPALESLYTGNYIQSVDATAFIKTNSELLTVYGYEGSYMDSYCDAYGIKFAAHTEPGSATEIKDVSTAAGTNPKTGKPCTVLTITMGDGSTKVFYLDSAPVSVTDVSAEAGTNPDTQKPCTVVTITLRDGSEEHFYLDSAPVSVTDVSFAAGINPETDKPCTVVTITLSDGSEKDFYLDSTINTIENISAAAGTNPETDKPCTVVTITMSDGSEKHFYLDNTVNSIEDISAKPGFDTNGKFCTVVTITLSDGSTESFYVYNGEDGKNGEDGEDAVVGGFADVPSGAYYADAVAWAVSKGVTTGTSASTFSPDAACTRAQVVTFLWRAMGCPEPAGSASFADVAAGSYYSKAVAWALEKGITTGTSATTFSPDAVCTRAQVVTFLQRALGGSGGGSTGFTDVPADAYYADAVAWAVSKGITTGTSASTFSPNAQCSRAQIVTFLYRAMA